MGLIEQESERKKFEERLPRMFHPQTIQELVAKNYLPYVLTGLAFSEILKAYRINSFSVALTQINENSERLEVALNPSKIYIPETAGKNSFDASKIVDLETVEERFPRRSYVRFLGLTSYLELAILHKERTGQDLFPQFIITNTPGKDFDELVFRSTRDGFQIESSSLLKPNEKAMAAVVLIPVARR